MSEKDPSDLYETDIEIMLQDRDLVNQCFRKLAQAFVAARGNAQHVREFAGCGNDHGFQSLAERRVLERLTFPYAVTIDESRDPHFLSVLQEESWWGQAGIQRDALQFVDDEGTFTMPGDVIRVGIMPCSGHFHRSVEEMVERKVRPLSVGELYAFQCQHPAQGHLVAALGSVLVGNGNPYIAYLTRTGVLRLWQRERQDAGVAFTVVADPYGRWKPWTCPRSPARPGSY